MEFIKVLLICHSLYNYFFKKSQAKDKQKKTKQNKKEHDQGSFIPVIEICGLGENEQSL